MSKQKPALFTAALFTAIATTALPAQEEKKEKKQPPAGAEMAMPDPRTKEHDALKAFVGDWDTVVKMPGTPGGEQASESKGTEHAELICNGLWLKSTLRASFGGEPFEGLWLHGYDPFQKTYVGLWADSSEPGVSSGTGRFDPAKKTWEWNMTTGQGPMRSVLVMRDADTMVETTFQKGDDGKEVQGMEITRTRRKAAASLEATARGGKAPSKDYEDLWRSVGDWNTVMKVEMAPGQVTEEKGSERVSPICSGKWLWTDFKCQFMGSPFEGHALIGYDPQEKKCTSFWLDSMTPVHMSSTGAPDASGKSVTLQGKGVDENGKPVTTSETITWKDDNTRVLKMAFKGEQPMNMEITYTRKK